MTEFRTKGRGSERKVFPLREESLQIRELQASPALLKSATPRTLEADARNILKAISESTSVDQLLLSLNKYSGLIGEFSPYNSVLIQEQDPSATIVRSADEWKRFGRVLKEDATPIEVLYPIGAGPHYSPGQIKEFVERKRKEGLSDEEIDALVREKFPISKASTHIFGKGKVYDISQTVKKDASIRDPTEVYRVSTLYDALKSVAKQYYRVIEEPVPKARGYTAHSGDQTKIVVMKIPDEEENVFHTLVHEVSHARLDHLNSKKEYGVNEAEAELSTYLVGAHYGLNFRHDSAAYISGWLKGKKLGEEEIDRAMNNARWVIQQIDVQLGVKQ